jgi:hypothetical protein
MEKPRRKFGDWSRSEFTIFLEMTAITLSVAPSNWQGAYFDDG